MRRLTRIAAVTGMAALSFFLCQPSHADTITMTPLLNNVELPTDNGLIRINETIPEFIEVGETPEVNETVETVEKSMAAEKSSGLSHFGQELMAIKFMLTCA